MKLLEDTPAVLSLGKLCEEHGYSYEWISGQKPHLILNGIRIQCNTENFVPIAVPGLSTTSSSSSTSTPTTPFMQEIDHSDHHPAIVSSENADRQVRGNPQTSGTPEELSHKPTKISKPNKHKGHVETNTVFRPRLLSCVVQSVFLLSVQCDCVTSSLAHVCLAQVVLKMRHHRETTERPV